ncbi:MAG TPA: SH3 domain-containing protein [Kofleriaceae bacterium]|nr:SH3 domain-containing protein [Kofleriaceae bacterium]
MRALGIALVLLWATTGSALAEKVKTNQETRVLDHPGEQGKLVVKVKEGQQMTLIGTEGRWLHVRVSGRTGWVARSKVEMADPDEMARNTRRRPFVDGRSTHRGFGSQEAPDDRIGADAVGGGDDTASDDDAKPAAKKPAKPAAKKPASKDDEGDDDDDAKPAAKKPAKPAAKPAAKKPASKDDEGDDDDDSKSAKKPAAKKDEDEAAADDTPKRAQAHVGAKTKVFGERDETSDVEFTAKPTDVLYPSETKGKWTKVETDEGDEGWILSDALEVEGGGGAGHGRTIALDVGIGVAFLQQGMRTVGTTKVAGTDQVPDAYNIGTSAASLSLGGSYYTGLGAKYLIGIDAGLNYSKTLGGGVTYMKTVTGLSISDYTLRAAIGYPTSRPSGLTLFARLGFRYRNYSVNDYNSATGNPAKIPQENLKAPTLGLAVVLPKLTQKLGLQVTLDTILFGATITQTAGLEDGATPKMTGVNLAAGLVYAWKPQMNLVFAYDLDYGGYDFGAPNTGAAAMSTRGHTGTDVTRTDIMHAVTVTLAKGF